MMSLLLRRVRASLSQKLIVPSDPAKRVRKLFTEAIILIRTTSGESSVNGVEVDVVHSKY